MNPTKKRFLPLSRRNIKTRLKSVPDTEGGDEASMLPMPFLLPSNALSSCRVPMRSAQRRTRVFDQSA